MLQRLMQPLIVYTELALSAALVLLGFAMRAWGGRSGSPRAGTFVIWLGVFFLVLSGLLLLGMRRRRGGWRAPPDETNVHVDGRRRTQLIRGWVGVALATVLVFLPDLLSWPEDEWWPRRITTFLGYGLLGAAIGFLVQGSRWQQRLQAVTSTPAAGTSDPPVAHPDVVRLDRRRRPAMTMGPLWWWLVAMVGLVAAELVTIMALQSAGNAAWRVVAIACGLLVVLLALGFFRSLLRRQRLYRDELAARGLRHGEPAPAAG